MFQAFLVLLSKHGGPPEVWKASVSLLLDEFAGLASHRKSRLLIGGLMLPL